MFHYLIYLSANEVNRKFALCPDSDLSHVHIHYFHIFVLLWTDNFQIEEESSEELSSDSEDDTS